MQKKFNNQEISDLADKYNVYDMLRDGQRKAVIDIIGAYQDGEKLIECPMPTASGKTLVGTIVAMILAKEFGHDLVLTTTPLVALADQYNNNPKYNEVMPCLIGKKNYQCGRFEGLTADDCPLKIRKDKDGEVITKLPPSCEKCEYRLAKERFDNSPMGYTTFDRFMYDPNIRGRANVLIIDESASIERKLRGYAEIELAMDCNDENLLPWLNERFNILIGKEKELSKDEELSSKDYINSSPENRMMYFNSMKRIKKDLQRTRKELWGVGKAINYVKEEVPYIITVDKKEKYNKDLKRKEFVDVKHFKLITAEKPFEELIKTLDFVVLMSGTPTTEQLTQEPYKVIEVEHPIPVEVRPTVFWKIGSMSFKTRDETAKKMSGVIAGIFREEKNNVIVHCGSYPVANLLYDNIIRQKGINREEVILQTSKTRKESLDKFLNSGHALYLSVEMAEGVDLAGEKFKVNIIANAAKPLWTDAYTVARNAYDSSKKGFNQWYDQSQATMIMQAYGRTSRHPTDESVTYILDSSIYSFWKRYNSMGNHRVQLFYKWFDSAACEL